MLLARLGEAYISSRDGVNGHMGLGIFIANTMVRHVQGKLEISNLKGGGASAHLTYPRMTVSIRLNSPLETVIHL